MARMDFTRSNVLSTPKWAGDYFSRDHINPWPAKLNAAEFTDALGAIVKLNGAAAADATSITVDALPVALPAGTNLHFGQSKEFARVTADAAKGATTVSVEALPSALEDNDEATYSQFNRKTVLSGTLLGRTYTERDAGTGFGPAVDTDDEIFLLVWDVVDVNTNNDCETYRPGSLVFENKLPGWTAISGNANLLADLRRVYECIKRD